METRPDESWNDDWLRQLVQFDEDLRLGRCPSPKEGAHPEIADTQQFLIRLQSLWPRQPKRIGVYALMGSLGQGTLGTTFQVEDSSTRKPYVLKMLWPNLSDDAEARSQILQDARATQHLRHANVAALRETREAGPVCCVISDYCPGPSLAQWRRAHPQPLALKVAVPFLAVLADVLDVAHRQGITHGNLKPSNIFLADEPLATTADLRGASLRVAEFALSKGVQQSRLMSQGGLPWPMPQFLAPEQLRPRGQAIGPASDLYALGMIAYELLTGRCPVKGNTRDEIAVQTRSGVTPSLRQYRPEIPGPLDALVLQCAHRQANARPASAKHVADALRAVLSGAHSQPGWWKQWLGWR